MPCAFGSCRSIRSRIPIRSALIAALQKSFGYPFTVEIEVVDELARTPAGKLKKFVSGFRNRGRFNFSLGSVTPRSVRRPDDRGRLHFSLGAVAPRSAAWWTLGAVDPSEKCNRPLFVRWRDIGGSRPE